MIGRGIGRMAGLWLGMASAGLAASPAGADDPLLRPVAPDLAPLWLDRQTPLRVHGTTWLVGFTRMNIVLIDSGAGLILIDAGLPQGVPLLERTIKEAGFDIRDVKLILSSEPHYDHASGLAALSRDSGATVLASQAGATVLRAGHSGMDDPQRTTLFAYPPVSHIRAVRDGQVVRLGHVRITAHASPGHTPGSMSWSWQSCDAVRGCASMLFAASLNSLTDGHYRYVAHKDVGRRFRRTFATIRALPCDMLLTGHPEHSDGAAKRDALAAAPNGDAFRSPDACRKLADRYEAAFDARLAQEAQ
ncbi:subclass B3 metallo-beta-lactamase [Sphingobium sp. CR2-8]|uniref:subclass B3 metallo-beta-lactamase n=1 Tax=Sphingobium sp. CR2-8 TaxID=1306534 RepID=UPI002DB7B039|nr:subclass B3 metallo-beta-lactamase [Sphingobium sp. CR2-8]MEC3911443.1 subclass B3 metallo-beta-lactamase [Sphingobium sp. CR2-8]